MLTFEPEKHQYFWNKEPVPGVSEILKETGQSKDWGQVPEYYRDRGSAVHKAVELWIKGTLDVASVDAVIQPYLDQFVKWTATQKAGIWMTEQHMYSEAMKFAGTVDLIANQTIWDLKCSKKLDKSSEWQYQMQGAGYRTLVRDSMGKHFPFKILLLTGEGDAKEIAMFSPYPAWENVMALYDIKTARSI